MASISLGVALKMVDYYIEHGGVVAFTSLGFYLFRNEYFDHGCRQGNSRFF